MDSRTVRWRVASRARGLRNYWINHPVVDAPVFIAFWSWSALSSPMFSADAGVGSRHVWYQTLTGLSAGLLGVGVASVTILYAVAPGDRLRGLLATVGSGLARLFAISIGLVAATAVSFGLAIPMDSAATENWVPAVVLGMAAVLSSNVGRLLWILHRVLRAIANDVAASDRPQKPFVAPEILDDDYLIVGRSAEERDT